MFHPSIVEAIDEIDAMVFSGDSLYDRENREQFEATLARWQRGVAEAKDIAEEDDE